MGGHGGKGNAAVWKTAWWRDPDGDGDGDGERS